MHTAQSTVETHINARTTTPKNVGSPPAFFNDACHPSAFADDPQERFLSAILELAPRLYAFMAEMQLEQGLEPLAEAVRESRLRGLRVALTGFDVETADLAARLRTEFGLKVSCLCDTEATAAHARYLGFDVEHNVDALLRRADIVIKSNTGLRLGPQIVNALNPHAVLVVREGASGVDTVALGHALWFDCIAGAAVLEADVPVDTWQGIRDCDSTVCA